MQSAPPSRPPWTARPERVGVSMCGPHRWRTVVIGLQNKGNMRDRPGLYRDIFSTTNTTTREWTGEWTLRSHRPQKYFTVGEAKYELPVHHLAPDPGLVEFLVNLSRGNSILDLGAGVGQYGRHILQQVRGATYTAFDGAVGVQAFSKGLVAHAKLHEFHPSLLPVMDWVVSLEVGEHIPFQFEHEYVSNLHEHNRKGILLSWAGLGQFGHGHVNNHSPSYIVSLFSAWGYRLDRATTWSLRKSTHHAWFRTGTYVFDRRLNPPPGPPTRP